MTFCWVLHSEVVLFSVYNYLRVQNSTKWPRICILHTSGFLSYFLLRGMLGELLAGVFLSWYVRSTTAFWSWCAGLAHKIESVLYLWGAKTDDKDTELSSLFKSSMSLAREKKLSVVKGWSFVLMEQSHRLTRQLVSNLVFKSCFFSFISTPFFCWFKSA